MNLQVSLWWRWPAAAGNVWRVPQLRADEEPELGSQLGLELGLGLGLGREKREQQCG